MAEGITSRFFNVIGLLSRSIPLIAIQLSAVQVNESITLTFTRVLDIYDPPVGEELEADPTDRTWWVKRGTAQTLEVVDRLAAIPMADGRPLQLRHNRGHIAVANARQQFAWLTPRKAGHCYIHLRLSSAGVEAATAQLSAEGIEVSPRSDGTAFRLTLQELVEHEGAVANGVQHASAEVSGQPVPGG